MGIVFDTQLDNEKGYEFRAKDYKSKTITVIVRESNYEKAMQVFLMNYPDVSIESVSPV